MNQATSVHDKWASGNGYEPFMGRWSRLVAREFVAWLGVMQGKRWLDVGCGTGALTETIFEFKNPAAVLGIDRSEAFVEYAASHITDPRATFRVGDAVDLKVERGAHEVVVSGLVLNFVPTPDRMVLEMARACRLNGRVAAYVWDYASGMQLLRNFWDAATELDPAVSELDELKRFEKTNAQALWNLFLDANLNDVTTRAIEVPTHFANFDDYWTPFLGGQGPAAGYAMSLSEDKRGALRERLRERLPTNADGSIDLTARAWAVKGTR